MAASDAQYKNATIRFIPLHFESLISNVQQQKGFHLDANNLRPHHMFCIIGIDESLVITLANKIREHPLFTNLKSFAYLVPSTIDITSFCENDTEADGFSEEE